LEVADLFFDLAPLCFRLVDLFAKLLAARDQALLLGGVFRLGDEAARFFLLVSQAIFALNEFAALIAESYQGREIGRNAAMAAVRFNEFLILTDELQVEHGRLERGKRKARGEDPAGFRRA
jgi:hypothetical protein